MPAQATRAYLPIAGKNSPGDLEVHYRVYRLNAAGRIVSGDWIEADNEQEACVEAHGFCNETTPVVELWQGARKLAVLPCEDEQAA